MTLPRSVNFWPCKNNRQHQETSRVGLMWSLYLICNFFFRTLFFFYLGWQNITFMTQILLLLAVFFSFTIFLSLKLHRITGYILLTISVMTFSWFLFCFKHRTFCPVKTTYRIGLMNVLFWQISWSNLCALEKICINIH